MEIVQALEALNQRLQLAEEHKRFYRKEQEHVEERNRIFHEEIASILRRQQEPQYIPTPVPTKPVAQIAPITITTDVLPTISSKIKLEPPTKYTGKKEELTGFLTALYSYFYLYSAQFYTVASCVLFATSRLDSNTLCQFEPTQRDFFLKLADEHDKFTTAIFESYKRFEEELWKVFRDTDEKRYTQERLASLYQTKSASIYATQFCQDSLQAGINDEGLIQLFYKGLKEEVKDELYRLDRPATLDEYIEIAIQIDDRLYVRKQQKKNDRRRTINSSNSNKNGKKKPAMSTSSGTYTGPIDIDAIQQTNRSRFSNITYYNYSRKRYLKRDYYIPKKKQQPIPRKEIAIVEGKERIVEIVAASYIQEDFEDNIERRLRYSDDVIEKTKEASNRRDSLLVGSINDSNTETNLLATDLEGEYIPNKAFLRLAKERSLSLR